MAQEQRQMTAQDVMVSFGARFNAECVRLGDQIHAAMVEREEKIAQLTDRIAALEAQIVPKDDDVK